MPPRRILTALLLGAMTVTVVMLFAPTVPGGGEVRVPGLDQRVPAGDKLVHLLLFAGLTAAARWRLGRRRWLVVALVGYAVLSEIVQGLLLPYRDGSGRDVVADLLGMTLAWLVWHRVSERPPVGRRGMPGRRAIPRR